MDNVTVQNLITHAYEQKPLEFQNSFNDLMASRLAAAVDNKKIEVAQSMFGSTEEVEGDVETEVEDNADVVDETDTTDQEEPVNGETA